MEGPARAGRRGRAASRGGCQAARAMASIALAGLAASVTWQSV